MKKETLYLSFFHPSIYPSYAHPSIHPSVLFVHVFPSFILVFLPSIQPSILFFLPSIPPILIIQRGTVISCTQNLYLASQTRGFRTSGCPRNANLLKSSSRRSTACLQQGEDWTDWKFFQLVHPHPHPSFWLAGGLTASHHEQVGSEDLVLDD